MQQLGGEGAFVDGMLEKQNPSLRKVEDEQQQKETSYPLRESKIDRDHRLNWRKGPLREILKYWAIRTRFSSRNVIRTAIGSIK